MVERGKQKYEEARERRDKELRERHQVISTNFH